MLRKASIYILSGLVIFFAAVSLLSIWEIIEIEHILRKSVFSLVVLFVSAAVLMFIFSMLNKESDESKRPLYPPIDPETGRPRTD